ncbi:MAG: hypothetical protein KAS86_00165 [Candidatus Omnitrophica bacterium]|nr:hypothetical protein [Candidatus Omnitrophota bacterium]
MDRVKIGVIIVVGVAVLVVAGLFVAGILGNRNAEETSLQFQKGIGYVSWSEKGYLTPGSDSSLEILSKTGADWVGILVIWYQTNCWSGDIRKLEITPSDEAVTHAIQKAHELGLKVMLKPHLDILDKSGGSWRGEIGCLKEEEWKAWFERYTAFIMHYVEMAREEKVEMVCIGTELSTTATTKGYLWRDLIEKIRGEYDGLLTYAAHWDRYMDIRFWDMLDYVGINAYFPLTEKLKPSREELRQGWQKWVREMEDFQGKIKKPIIFPEIGCNACDGAAIRPWEHAPRREVNLKLQADFYRVLQEVFFEKKWFYGQYWWYWGTNPNMGGRHNRGFTFQNKPAEQVVKEWYAKPVPAKTKFDK